MIPKPMISKIILSAAGTAAFTKSGTVLRKDFIREGNWVLPDGTVLPVNKTRIQKWSDTFKLFRERGISVPLTVDHIEVHDPITKQNKVLRANSNMAGAKRGDVVGMDLDGSLGMFNAMPSNPKAEELMGSCQEVSLELTKDFLDTDGNYYDEAITAITMTPKPVIPGQKEWTRVAAGRSDDGTTVYLSAEPLTTKPAPVAQPLEILMLTPEQIKLARTLCSVPAVAKDEDVPDLMLKFIADQKIAISGANEQVTKLSRDVTAAQTATAAAGQPITLDEDAADMMATAFETRINNLGAKAVPAQRTMLSRLICGVPAARPAICLSRKAAQKVGLSAALGDEVLKIFEAGDPTEMAKLLQEQSKTQTRQKLSRETGNTADDTFDQKTHDEMVSSAKNQGAGSSQPMVL